MLLGHGGCLQLLLKLADLRLFVLESFAPLHGQLQQLLFLTSDSLQPSLKLLAQAALSLLVLRHLFRGLLVLLFEALQLAEQLLSLLGMGTGLLVLQTQQLLLSGLSLAGIVSASLFQGLQFLRQGLVVCTKLQYLGLLVFQSLTKEAVILPLQLLVLLLQLDVFILVLVLEADHQLVVGCEGHKATLQLLDVLALDLHLLYLLHPLLLQLSVEQFQDLAAFQSLIGSAFQDADELGLLLDARAKHCLLALLFLRQSPKLPTAVQSVQPREATTKSAFYSQRSPDPV
ncbi:hypothetical protein LEMLEM_LOCUS16275 [Lemmus lemmus]